MTGQHQDPSQGEGEPEHEVYVPPAILWEEVMEDAGVYAACAKDPFEPIGEGCLAFPRTGGS